MSKKAIKKIKRIFLSKKESCIISITVRSLTGEIQKGSDLSNASYKTPCFSYGDIRRVHRIYASN